MDILEKVSGLLCDGKNVDILYIDSILAKYGLSFPLSFDDIFMFSDDDLKEILKCFDANSYLELYDAFMGNYTVIKMYKSNPGNSFFKDKFDKASVYVNNLVLNLNALYNKADSAGESSLFKKYGDIIKSDGIMDSVVNFDEFDELLNSLKLSIREKGEIKREVGKANIRFAGIKSSSADFSVIDEAEDVLRSEQGLIDSVSDSEFDKFIESGISPYDDNRLEIVSVLMALYGEVNRARDNVSNLSVFNGIVKQIGDYLVLYRKLKEEVDIV